jgi:hypothetical protein
MRLRPNGGQAKAKLRQETRVFDRISSKLKYLHVMLINLSALRQRCGEPRAKWRPDGKHQFLILAAAMKLRKIFLKEAARR